MKKTVIAVISVLLMTALAVTLVACNKFATEGWGYSIPQFDLSTDNNIPKGAESLYEKYIIDNASDYMAHPDTVLVDRNGDGVGETLMTMYPEGHGKGAVLTKESTDGGKNWSERRTNTPSSWVNSLETPTVYKLDFNDGSHKIVMISANPSWGVGHGDGFNASYSSDEGRNWTEFRKFYGWKDKHYVNPIVAMASLTRLKDENGNWRDAWMGFFHDYDFINYKTILTFDEAGNMNWSVPEKYFAAHRDIEKASQMCEVEVIRSDNGQGKELCLIGRANGKDMNSIISFSFDEGVTWSKPREVAAALNGERHKADFLLDGRLVITFRSIERSPAKLKGIEGKYKQKNWYSEGWIAWVGTFNDLKNMYIENGRGKSEGQYRIKLAHTYLDGQNAPHISANADTGYCGNAVLSDGKYFTSSYGTFGEKKADGSYKTYIIGKIIDFNLLEEKLLLK